MLAHLYVFFVDGDLKHNGQEQKQSIKRLDLEHSQRFCGT